ATTCWPPLLSCFLIGAVLGLLQAALADQRFDRCEVLGGHSFEDHAHTKDPHAVAFLHVDHFSRQLANSHSTGATELQLGADLKRLEGIDETTTRTEFQNFGGKRSSILQRDLGVRSKREARVGALHSKS